MFSIGLGSAWEGASEQSTVAETPQHTSKPIEDLHYFHTNNAAISKEQRG